MRTLESILDKDLDIPEAVIKPLETWVINNRTHGKTAGSYQILTFAKSQELYDIVVHGYGVDIGVAHTINWDSFCDRVEKESKYFMVWHPKVGGIQIWHARKSRKGHKGCYELYAGNNSFGNHSWGNDQKQKLSVDDLCGSIGYHLPLNNVVHIILLNDDRALKEIQAGLGVSNK